jgi:uncharacterized protein YciI
MRSRGLGGPRPGSDTVDEMATHFAVVREEQGPAWDYSRPRNQQKAWPEHAKFMNGLVEEGFVVLGGPLRDGPHILLVVRAESEDVIRARFDRDPWVPMGLIRVASVDPWTLLLGELPG